MRPAADRATGERSGEGRSGPATGGCSVVRVRPELWERYRAVRLAALQDSPEMFGSTHEREIAFTEAEWRRRAERPATFLAVRSGSDVGIAGAYEFDAGWCVMGMWVHPEVRGSGAAGALLDACAGVARDHDADHMSLWVMEDNPRGIRAYERGGFRLTGERDAGRDGRWELVMTRDLSPMRPDDISRAGDQ